MNKIERAIKDTTTELKRLRNNKICIDSKIEALEEQLESLESIERDKSIPHIEVSKEMSVNLPNLKLEANGTTLTSTNPDGKLGTITIKAQNG